MPYESIINDDLKKEAHTLQATYDLLWNTLLHPKEKLEQNSLGFDSYWHPDPVRRSGVDLSKYYPFGTQPNAIIFDILEYYLVRHPAAEDSEEKNEQITDVAGLLNILLESKHEGVNDAALYFFGQCEKNRIDLPGKIEAIKKEQRRSEKIAAEKAHKDEVIRSTKTYIQDHKPGENLDHLTISFKTLMKSRQLMDLDGICFPFLPHQFYPGANNKGGQASRSAAMANGLELNLTSQEITGELPTPPTNDTINSILKGVHGKKYLDLLKKLDKNKGMTAIDEDGDLYLDSNLLTHAREITRTLIKLYSQKKETPIMITATLPGHHFHKETGPAGFCMIDTRAIAIKIAGKNVLSIDLDINMSTTNGCKIDLSSLHHIEVGDSRVYPWRTPEESAKTTILDLKDDINTPRSVLDEIKEIIKTNSEESPIDLVISLGFDSCIHDITFDLVKDSDGAEHTLSPEEKKSCRFTTEQFQDLYKYIGEKVKEGKILSVNYVIEGGYDLGVLTEQMNNLRQHQKKVNESKMSSNEEPGMAPRVPAVQAEGAAMGMVPRVPAAQAQAEVATAKSLALAAPPAEAEAALSAAPVTEMDVVKPAEEVLAEATKNLPPTPEMITDYKRILTLSRQALGLKNELAEEALLKDFHDAFFEITKETSTDQALRKDFKTQNPSLAKPTNIETNLIICRSFYLFYNFIYNSLKTEGAILSKKTLLSYEEAIAIFKKWLKNDKTLENECFSPNPQNSKVIVLLEQYYKELRERPSTTVEGATKPSKKSVAGAEAKAVVPAKNKRNSTGADCEKTTKPSKKQKYEKPNTRLKIIDSLFDQNQKYFSTSIKVESLEAEIPLIFLKNQFKHFFNEPDNITLKISKEGEFAFSRSGCTIEFENLTGIDLSQNHFFSIGSRKYKLFTSITHNSPDLFKALSEEEEKVYPDQEIFKKVSDIFKTVASFINLKKGRSSFTSYYEIDQYFTLYIQEFWPEASTPPLISKFIKGFFNSVVPNKKLSKETQLLIYRTVFIVYQQCLLKEDPSDLCEKIIELLDSSGITITYDKPEHGDFNPMVEEIRVAKTRTPTRRPSPAISPVSFVLRANAPSEKGKSAEAFEHGKHNSSHQARPTTGELRPSASASASASKPKQNTPKKKPTAETAEAAEAKAALKDFSGNPGSIDSNSFVLDGGDGWVAGLKETGDAPSMSLAEAEAGDAATDRAFSSPNDAENTIRGADGLSAHAFWELHNSSEGHIKSSSVQNEYLNGLFCDQVVSEGDSSATPSSDDEALSSDSEVLCGDSSLFDRVERVERVEQLATKIIEIIENPRCNYRTYPADSLVLRITNTLEKSGINNLQDKDDLESIVNQIREHSKKYQEFKANFEIHRQKTPQHRQYDAVLVSLQTQLGKRKPAKARPAKKAKTEAYGLANNPLTLS